ncbi:MAG: hypothetical protein WAT09_04510 [Paracoccaceae bacterium]
MFATRSTTAFPAARRRGGDRIPSPRRLVAMITAGAAALSLILAAAMPAQAGGSKDDLAKSLIAALVIGAIIHETRKPDPAPTPVTPESVRKKRGPYVHDRNVIPSVCALQFEGPDRGVTVYPERCLLREGISRRALPRDCAKEARIYGKWDRIYSQRCLRQAGFEMRRDKRRY